MNFDFDIQARYQLFCRVGQTQSAHPNTQTLLAELNQLNTIINTDLPTLARQGSPDNFTDILRNLQQELDRFRNFCAFPTLSQKNIVGIGGRFSAGKSSFINTLLGKKCLITDVNPTTSLPTYLLHNETVSINAINIFQQSISLSEEEFQSLTHEEQEKYGSQISALLQSAHVQTPDFPWQNLAILDTPGYTKPETNEYSERTDAQIAYAQLKSANYLIWLVSADDGTITEDDITFLASLNLDIPCLVLLNKADKKPPSGDDIEGIIALVRNTLVDRNIPVLDVIPVANKGKDKEQYPIQAVHQYLNNWNTQPQETTFARNFKQQFLQYHYFIYREEHYTALRLERLERVIDVLMMSSNNEMIDNINSLKKIWQLKQEQLKNLKNQLHDLQNQFFKTIASIGNQVGIKLSEPDELDLIELNGECTLPEMLLELLSRIGETEKDFSGYWNDLIMSPDTKFGLKNLFDGVIDDTSDFIAADLMTSSHYTIRSSLNIRNSYAILLAAVLCTSQPITMGQMHFFNALLNALELEKPLAYYLHAGKNLNTDALHENMLALIDENDVDMKMFFLLDSVILLRIAGRFSHTQNRIIKLFFNCFFSDSDINNDINLLESIAFQCAKILKLPYSHNLEKDYFYNDNGDENSSHSLNFTHFRKKTYMKKLELFFMSYTI